MRSGGYDKKILSSYVNHLVLLCVLIFICAVAFPEVSAEAESLHCGNRIVSTGDRKFEVLARCGQPDFRTTRYEKRIMRDFFPDLFPPGDSEREGYRKPLFVEELVEIEEWVYNPGPTKLIRYLTFENGILVHIETGGYGY